MSLDEFLYEDEDLFHAYQKAYYTRTSFNSWVQGMYNYNAQSVVMANAFSKNDKKIEYVDKPLEFIEKDNTQSNKNTLTNRNLNPKEQDQAYRDYMVKYVY